MPSNAQALTCMWKCKTMNKLTLITFLLLLITTVIAIVGVALPRWLETSTWWFGLFESCSRVFDVCSSTDLDNLPDWHRATQAMALIGVICLCVACLMSPCYFFNIWGGCPLKPSQMTAGNILLTALAGICLLISVAIYGDHFGTDADYGAGLGLTIVAGILSLVITVLVLVMKKKGVAPS